MLQILYSNRLPIFLAAEIQHHSVTEAPLKRDFIDGQRGPSTVHGRVVMIRSVEMYP
jgi:hypothetical protein